MVRATWVFCDRCGCSVDVELIDPDGHRYDGAGDFYCADCWDLRLAVAPPPAGNAVTREGDVVQAHGDVVPVDEGDLGRLAGRTLWVASPEGHVEPLEAAQAAKREAQGRR